MNKKILLIPLASFFLLLLQWKIHDFNVSLIQVISTLFYFLINALIFFKVKIIYSTIIGFVLIGFSGVNLNLHLFPRTHIESLGISFKSFVRVDTRFNKISKIKKNDVVMINSIHGKFAKVVSLPGEKAAINKRDWLGFFSENKKIEELKDSEVSVEVGGTKIIIKVDKTQIVGKIL